MTPMLCLCSNINSLEDSNIGSYKTITCKCGIDICYYPKWGCRFTRTIGEFILISEQWNLNKVYIYFCANLILTYDDINILVGNLTESKIKTFLLLK